MEGHKLRVWWPAAQQYHTGTVERFNPKMSEHHIRYEDDTQEDLWLAVESFEDLGKHAKFTAASEGMHSHSSAVISLHTFMPC